MAINMVARHQDNFIFLLKHGISYEQSFSDSSDIRGLCDVTIYSAPYRVETHEPDIGFYNRADMFPSCDGH